MNLDLARVSNDIIQKASEENRYLPPTKLLKLVYFLYGHYIQKTDEVLFSNKFQAWEHGPVVPELYNAIKGKENIEQFIEMPDGKCYITNPISEYGKRYFEVFNYVWNKYKVYSATFLSDLTHAVNSPWEVTRRLYGKGKEISSDLIKRYFEGGDISNG